MNFFELSLHLFSPLQRKTRRSRSPYLILRRGAEQASKYIRHSISKSMDSPNNLSDINSLGALAIIPAELRIKIWQYALQAHLLDPLDSNGVSTGGFGLLITNRTIYAEVMHEAHAARHLRILLTPGKYAFQGTRYSTLTSGRKIDFFERFHTITFTVLAIDDKDPERLFALMGITEWLLARICGAQTTFEVVLQDTEFASWYTKGALKTSLPIFKELAESGTDFWHGEGLRELLDSEDIQEQVSRGVDERYSDAFLVMLLFLEIEDEESMCLKMPRRPRTSAITRLCTLTRSATVHFPDDDDDQT